MDWVKLSTNYYLDPAIMRAGEDAEVLFTRAMAYVGDHETDGVVPREALDRLTPKRGPARARALVAAGLWEVVTEGWRFVQWERHQESREQMAARREGGRVRQARHRQRARNAVTNAVSDGGVTGTEVEEEVEEAAAAARAAAAADHRSTDLPGPLAILRSKLQAHTPLRGLRFDTLTAEQAEQLLTLIAEHGDEPLVRVAIDTCRNPAPTYVTAFLGTWAALPPPGHRLHAVTQRLCDTHGTRLSPAGTCSSCQADQKAAR